MDKIECLIGIIVYSAVVIFVSAALAAAASRCDEWIEKGIGGKKHD